MEFPSLLIWPVSILPVYFNFLFLELKAPHDSSLFISLQVCVSIIYVHSEELCSLIVKVLFPGSYWECIECCMLLITARWFWLSVPHHCSLPEYCLLSMAYR